MRTFRNVSRHWALGCIVLSLTLVCLTGCQAMMKGKSKKAHSAQDKFSCGETLPGRNSR